MMRTILKTRTLRNFIFLTAMLSPFTSYAGNGWVSSGGEISEDSKNPWFVSSPGNPARVSYCLQLETQGISASESQVRSALEFAIAYWRTQFSQKWSSWHGRAESILSAGVWSESACGPTTDVGFKFGYGTLDSDEIAHLENPERFAGVSIRKAYDKKLLRGRGIVFISSDRGTNRYRKQGTKWIDEAWSVGSGNTLLKYILIHEVGHVFGLTHSGVGVMAEAFFDQMMNQQNAPMFAASPIEGTFSNSPRIATCLVSVEARTALGISPVGRICIRLDVSAGIQNPAGQWTLEISPELSPGVPSGDWKLHGSFGQFRYDLINDIRLSPAVRLTLPKEQALFGGDDADRGFVHVAHWLEAGAQTMFTPVGSSPRAFRVSITPQSLDLIAISNGTPSPVLRWSSLISKKLSVAQMGEK